MDLATIKETVCACYGLPAMAMTAPMRWREYARPRQVAMYLASQLTEKSLTQIGQSFRRDHTTVLHGIRNIERLRATNPAIRADVSALLRELAE